MRWLELTAAVDGSDVDVVAEVLGRFGYGGVAIEEQGSQATVRIFLPIDNSLAQRRLELEEGLTQLVLKSPPKFDERESVEQDWETSWKKYYKTLAIGERLIIKPSWEDYTATPEQVVIEIDPGMAFGTGQHATTRVCLVALERHLRPGMAVLDLGTGSGILAIAAAKLGASQVLALDISPAAVAVATSNAQANGVFDLMTVALGTLPRDKTWRRNFDLVVANITAQVIDELAEPLMRSLKPQGILIAGGIIEECLEEVSMRLQQARARIIDVLSDGEWRTIVARSGEG